MLADWLQGPGIYALYRHYGFSIGEIGMLFVIGFGSSLLFGTVVASLADTLGRRNNCIAFAVIYALSCATKHFPHFWVLAVGRVLGGVATSILASVFETWMIHEHRKAAFPDEWMQNTFARMIFGSGIAAIVAGLLAAPLMAWISPVAPFDLSMLLLLAGGVYIAMHWKENFGDAMAGAGSGVGVRSALSLESFSRAYGVLRSNERVLLVGAIQSCFEGAMFIFVFIWTPVLESATALASGELLQEEGGTEAPDASPEGEASVPHGLIFASFMVCVMIGSSLFESLQKSKVLGPLPRWARMIYGVSAVAVVVPGMLRASPMLSFSAFCAFEVCCGAYFPAIATIRGQVIPGEIRATLMNVFRIGVNLIVLTVLLNVAALSHGAVLAICGALLAAGTAMQARLSQLTAGAGGADGAKTAPVQEAARHEAIVDP